MSWTAVSLPAWSHPTESLAYDSARGRTLALSDTDAWEFDGTAWTNRPLPDVLPAGFGRLAYDSRRARIVGVGPQGLTAIYRGPAQPAFARLGPGCAGSAGVPSLSATQPALGATMTLTLGGLPAASALAHLGAGFQASSWFGHPLPFELSAFGLPGCVLWIDSQPALGAWLVANGGVAVRTIALPNDPAFAGLRIWFQGSVLDPGVPAGLVLSDAGVATLH